MIKVGDLVAVIKPTQCCGATARIGLILNVFSFNYPPNKSPYVKCRGCGLTRHFDSNDVVLTDGFAYQISRLKKIDPPSEGETREAYVNLKQPRKVTA